MKVSSFQPMQAYDAATRAAAQKPTEQPALQSAARTGNAPAGVISQEELKYFTDLYPEQSKEISSYSTYSKSGISPEYSVGSLVDKKS